MEVDQESEQKLTVREKVQARGVLRDFLTAHPEIGVTLGFPDERKVAEARYGGDESQYVLSAFEAFVADLGEAEEPSVHSGDVVGGVRVRFYNGPHPGNCNAAFGPFARAWVAENELRVVRLGQVCQERLASWVINRENPRRSGWEVPGYEEPCPAVEIISAHNSPWDAPGPREGEFPSF